MIDRHERNTRMWQHVHFCVFVYLFLSSFGIGLAGDAPAWAELEKEYGVILHHAGGPFRRELEGGAVSGTAPPAKVAQSYINSLLVPELRLYSPKVVKAIGFREVLFCASVSVDIASPPIHGRPRNIVWDDRIWYIDVVSLDRSSLFYQRRAFHHEIFHLIDKFMRQLVSDPTWSGLNKARFKYGRGGVFAETDPAAAVITTPAAGFLTKYSMSALAEDKAELFSLMVVCPAEVKKHCAADPILAAKTELMRKRICSAFMDKKGEFWDRSQSRATALRRKTQHSIDFDKVYETMRRLLKTQPKQ